MPSGGGASGLPCALEGPPPGRRVTPGSRRKQSFLRTRMRIDRNHDDVLRERMRSVAGVRRRVAFGLPDFDGNGSFELEDDDRMTSASRM